MNLSRDYVQNRKSCTTLDIDDNDDDGVNRTREALAMEEPESPPTPNILRPHHISLLMVIMLLYRHYPRKRFHPSFLIQVHRVLLEEIVEVSFPMY